MPGSRPGPYYRWPVSAGTYANDRTVCDADSHFMELADLFDRIMGAGRRHPDEQSAEFCSVDERLSGVGLVPMYEVVGATPKEEAKFYADNFKRSLVGAA